MPPPLYQHRIIALTLSQELRARGWSSADIIAISSGNILRVMRAAATKAGTVTVPSKPVSPAPPGGGNPANLGPKSAPVALAQQVVAAMNPQVGGAVVCPPHRTLVTLVDCQVDPCDDFYEYSCGGWIANNDIPSDKSSWCMPLRTVHCRGRSQCSRVLPSLPLSRARSVNYELTHESGTARFLFWMQMPRPQYKPSSRRLQSPKRRFSCTTCAWTRPL